MKRFLFLICGLSILLAVYAAEEDYEECYAVVDIGVGGVPTFPATPALYHYPPEISLSNGQKVLMFCVVRDADWATWLAAHNSGTIDIVASTEQGVVDNWATILPKLTHGPHRDTETRRVKWLVK